MEKVIKFQRPLNHSYKKDWYWNHDKRLQDALVAQVGIVDEGVHADGLHKNQPDPFGRR